MASGIEHPQSAWLTGHFHGKTDAPDASLYYPAKATPNQALMAAAIALAYRDDPAPALKLFAAMAEYGHQATTAAGYGCEQCCSAPHGELWLYGAGSLLRDSRRAHPDVHAAAIRYFAAHLALLRSFWTPAGFRAPGSRANLSIPGGWPNWPADSLVRAHLDGLPVDGLDRSASPALAIFFDCEEDFPAILAAVQPAAVKLLVPIRQWLRPGAGFVAALAEDLPMNGRLSWLETDGAGNVLAADDTLGTLPPEVAGRAPDLIFGAPGTAAGSAPALPPVPTPTPPSAAGGTLDPLLAEEFAKRLSGLGLSRQDISVRSGILHDLQPGIPLYALHSMANRVAALGIGLGQPQYHDQQTLVDDMRAAAAAGA